jgi:hypothetical protein
VIALLAAAVGVSPAAVLTKYTAALAALHEPRVFAVGYVLEQSGARTLDQEHQVFRAGGDERDEIVAVNGNRASQPEIRIFHGRKYRYTVAALAPRVGAYAFTYVGTHRNGHHDDFVFATAQTVPSSAYVVRSVTIDGETFLPAGISFTTSAGHARGTVTFAKQEHWWVASSATATAHTPAGATDERITFSGWRFPTSLPPSTFAVARRAPRAVPATGA